MRGTQDTAASLWVRNEWNYTADGTVHSTSMWLPNEVAIPFYSDMDRAPRQDTRSGGRAPQAYRWLDLSESRMQSMTDAL